MRPTTDIILSFQTSIFNGLLEPCVRAARAGILRDLEQRWTEHIDYNVRRILCIWAMLDPRFKTIKDTTLDFTESMLDMDSVFEFELLVRSVPKEPDAVSALFSYKRYIHSNRNKQLIGSVGFKSIWRHLHVQLSCAQ